MSVDTAAPPGPTHSPPTRPASRSQLSWLETQVRDWQTAGIVDDDQAGRIVTMYRVDHRFPLARLLLTIGAVFVGVGVIWLVAANIDSLTPTTRFVGIVLLWLGTLVGAELLSGTRDTDRSSPLVGAIRLMAALAFGGVVFQAAQTLQVPAYEPTLVGCWAVGALLHAYAVRAVLPLVVAVLAGATWLSWAVLAESDSGLAVVLCQVLVAVAAVSAAALHARWAPELGVPWRELGAAFLLCGLFGAALPFVDGSGFDPTTTLVVAVVLAGAAAVAAVVAAVVAADQARWEVLVTVAASTAACALAAWDVDEVVHAVVGVAVYAVVAVGVAVVGTLRDSWRLTAMATLGLVVFTTFQSFAVFAEILQGAWLFVALGLVFLGTGVVFDRARRQIVAAVTDEETSR